MSAYEYKTVALPSLVRAKRRRRQSEADLVAETLGETIAAEAVDGWDYMRADTLSAVGGGGLFSRADRETPYTVLIFRRARADAWRADDDRISPSVAGIAPREPAPQAVATDPAPIAPAATGQAPRAARPPRPHPVQPPAPPVTSIAQGTPAAEPAAQRPIAVVDDISGTMQTFSTGGTFTTQAEPPRPPLGSARD